MVLWFYEIYHRKYKYFSYSQTSFLSLIMLLMEKKKNLNPDQMTSSRELSDVTRNKNVHFNHMRPKYAF